MYFLTEIRVSDFEAGVMSAQGRFKVVSPCTNAENRASAKVFEAVKGMHANDQRQAQNEANAQDSAKQKQAEQDELNTEFQQAQPQADQQADAALSSILDQKP